MVNHCFSGDCGFCSGCSGDVGNKVVWYLQPGEFYKENTGKDPPTPAPAPKTARFLWGRMMYESIHYRIHLDSTWGRFARRLIRRKKSRLFTQLGGIYGQIRDSHIEFLKGCTEEGLVYGEKRCLKPESDEMDCIIRYGGIDINTIAGKVVIRGGGYFDIDALRKQMNLNNEDYEEYFDKFQTYLVEVNEKLKEYGTTMGADYRGKVPEFINIGDKKYKFWEDNRIMCDDPDCSLMGHCMINWDEENNYTGTNTPSENSYYYSNLIAKIPKYTHNQTHELCLTCALRHQTQFVSKDEVV